MAVLAAPATVAVPKVIIAISRTARGSPTCACMQEKSAAEIDAPHINSEDGFRSVETQKVWRARELKGERCSHIIPLIRVPPARFLVSSIYTPRCVQLRSSFVIGSMLLVGTPKGSSRPRARLVHGRFCGCVHWAPVQPAGHMQMPMSYWQLPVLQPPGQGILPRGWGLVGTAACTRTPAGNAYILDTRLT